MFKAVKTMIDNVFTESKSTPTPVTLPPQVDTLEKAQSFHDMWFAERQKFEHLGVFSQPLRREFVGRQLKAAGEAVSYHQAIAKTDVYLRQFEADQKQLKEAIEATQATVSTAEKAAQAATKKHDDLIRRLVPLTEKLNAEAAQVQTRIEDAQKLFDAAMASGNEADEALAAEALALAKTQGQTQTQTDSPVEIRVTALTKELAVFQVQRDEAEKALACAIDDFLEAKANLSKFQYDQKVFELACFAVQHQSEFGSAKSEKRLHMDTHGSTLKINSPSRFFMDSFDGSSLNFQRLVDALKKPSPKKTIQNSELYAKSIGDMPEEHTEEEPHAQTLEEILRRKERDEKRLAMA